MTDFDRRLDGNGESLTVRSYSPNSESLWASGISAGNEARRYQPSEVDASKYAHGGPITERDADLWSHLNEVISHVVMLCADLTWEESHRPEPNREKLQRWGAIQLRVGRERHRGGSKIHSEIERLISEYRSLVRELEAEV